MLFEEEQTESIKKKEYKTDMLLEQPFVEPKLHRSPEDSLTS